jgi:DNA-binding transcriptional regulator YdaS (Cro superfamily)
MWYDCGMKLSKYLSQAAVSEAEFAKSIGVASASVNRYCQGERVPEPTIMRKIYKATHGAVTANDFFNLPALKKKCCPPDAKAEQ